MSEITTLDELVAALREAAVLDDAAKRVKSLLEAAVAAPEDFAAGLPAFADNDTILFEDETVSIWHCHFEPGSTVPPHDHQMTATIGLYQGLEQNHFFRRDAQGRAQRDSSVSLRPGEVLQMAPGAIHAVSGGEPDGCSGIHVYLGRLTTVERSLFDPDSGERMDFSDDNYQRLIQRPTADS